MPQGSEFANPPMPNRVITCKPQVVEFVLPPSLAAGLAVRYQPRVVRSPAARAPGVRSGRSCHTQPTRPWESPVRPAVGSGRSSHTRLQQPASRSAFGRVLSPPYAAVRPNARFTRGAWSACVTPGQRRTPYARSSGLLPSRGRPRTARPAASAGGKGSLRRQRDSHRTPPATVSQPLHQQPAPRSVHQKPRQSRDGPARNPVAPASTREHLRALGVPPAPTDRRRS